MLEALREAHRTLRPERVIPALDGALGAFRDPDSPFRKRLREEHPVYSAAALDLGCERGLRGWTARALSDLRARELRPTDRAPQVTAVWLAGSVPTAAFAALVQPLLAGSAVYAKPASADPLSPELFRQALLEADPDVGGALRLGTDPRALEQADAVVVHGRDETVAELRARVPVGRTFIGHGHKVSVAAVGTEIAIDEAARALALDVALWDGRGCLSPAWILVEDGPEGRAERLARALAAALEPLEASLPRGPLSAGEAVFVHELRARAAVREEARLFAGERVTSYAVVLEPAGSHPPPGSLRSVPVVPVTDLDRIVDWCGALAPHLSCVGNGGFEDRLSRIAEAAARGGGSRVCPLGRMQLPPIDWNHDGVAPLAGLAGRIDVETGEEPT